MKGGPIPIEQFEGRKGTQEPRVRLIAFNDIKLGKKRRYVVKGLIPRVGLTVVWGPPKSGKSFWTFDLVMHVALDWEYRGRRVSHGPVVYCAFEGQTGLEARIEAFRQRHLPEFESEVPFYLQPATLDLVAEQHTLIAVIRKRIGDTPPAIVVLDTLNRSLRGSESSDEDMGAYVKAADAIREEFECAVIIVHHCGVEGTRPRGHTSLTGAVDAQLSVKRDNAGNIVVETEWMKDGPEGEIICSKLDAFDVGVDEDGESISSCVILPVEENEHRQERKPASIPKNAKIAMRALEEAIIDAGQIAPASNHIPEAVKVVSVDLWRDYAYRRSITTSDKPRARQIAFQRAAEHLTTANLIGTWDGHVWIA